MKFFTHILFSLLLSINLLGWSDIHGGRGDFVTDSTFHILYGGVGNTVLGDFTATGNSILYVDDGSTPSLINSHTSFKDVDTAFHATTYSLGDNEKLNSSSATLSLPSYVQGKDIVWAGLFWQGHIYRANGTYDDAKVDNTAANWNKITIKDSKGVMHSITAPLNSNNATHKAFHLAIHGDGDNRGFRYHYGAYYDITDIMKNSYSSTDNTYTVGNLKTTAGKDTGGYVYIKQAPEYSGNYRFGLYGGWSIIVVYDVDGPTSVTNNVPAKNISLYDGFDLYLTWGDGDVPFETTLNLSGFYTPKSGTINSKLLLFGGAGDKGIEDDTLQLQDKKNVGTFLDLSNAPNNAGKQFNHTYTLFGNHMTPGDTNKQGMDLDIFDVSDKMDHAQTSTKIKFGVVKTGNHCDQIFPQVIAFSTQLYEPKFCYDYAYSQQGIYFTEDNDGTHDPKLVGNIIKNEPIKMKIFIRNLIDSDLQIEDMNVSVLDINTTQTTYIRETTRLAKTGTLVPVNIADSSLHVSDSYIKGIEVNDLSSKEFFYTYYQLDPQKDSLDMPIKIKATYNLRVNASTTIPYELNLGANVPICSDGNFAYSPTKGIFNLVHNNYYNLDTGGSNKYYNLPTQVIAREGNFKVISMNPDSLDDLKGSSTIVAVEMIDASAFHDVNASCSEIASSISPKVWVILHDDLNDANVTSAAFNKAAIDAAIANGMTDLNNSAEFYAKARTNAAFRISYNVTNDGNDDLVKIKNGANPGEYEINFTELTQNLTTCVQDMDGNVNNTDTVATYCGNASDKLTKEDIATCMRCVYGFNTRFVCSRDNFAIRPESFNLRLEDQDQENPTLKQPLTIGYSGVSGATAPILDLASDYNYNLEVNATDHLGNSASEGYTKTFTSSMPNDFFAYEWEPRSTITSNACNDEDNKSIEARFINGSIELNSSVAQVGEYRLHIKDTSWTAVDSDISLMQHHNNSYFAHDGSGFILLDCTQNTSSTQVLNSGFLNGCNISSSHINPDNNIKYNDYNVTFHPYKLNVSNTFTLGLADTSPVPPAVITDPKPFVYMANILGVDENVSVHLNTTVTPVGRNGSSLNNFVSGCFAKPLNFTIKKTVTVPIGTVRTPIYDYRIHNKDSNGSIITSQNIDKHIPMNDLTQNPQFATTGAFFQKDQIGTIQLRTNLNYYREVNTSINPHQVNYDKILVDDNVTLFNADLITNKIADGNITMNQHILHYYGRAIAPTIIVVCNSNTCRTGLSATNDNNIRNLISYAIFCDSPLPSPFLPTGSQHVGTAKWWENRDHDRNVSLPIGTDGRIGLVNEEINTTQITDINDTMFTPNYTREVVIQYSGALPYTAKMKMLSSPWLIYDENNISAVYNKSTIKFVGNGGWNGKYEDNTTTKSNYSPITNRRIMW